MGLQQLEGSAPRNSSVLTLIAHQDDPRPLLAGDTEKLLGIAHPDQPCFIHPDDPAPQARLHLLIDEQPGQRLRLVEPVPPQDPAAPPPQSARTDGRFDLRLAPHFPLL